MRGLLFSIFLLVSSAAWANEAEKLHGNWTLVSFFTEDVQQRVNAYGEKPTGAGSRTILRDAHCARLAFRRTSS
jgi:hypothetical protein